MNFSVLKSAIIQTTELKNGFGVDTCISQNIIWYLIIITRLVLLSLDMFALSGDPVQSRSKPDQNANPSHNKLT